MLQSFIFFVFILPLSAAAGYDAFQGDDCILSNSTLFGTCMEIAQCDFIKKNLQGNDKLEFCGSGTSTAKNRLICCPNLPSKQGDNCYIWGYMGQADDPRYPNIVGKCIPLEECETAKSLLQFRERQNTCLLGDKIVCCPLQKFPPIKTKAEEKCAEYYYVTVGGGYGLAYGGIYALPEEFPHMAAVGFNENNATNWFCGGSLISEYFIVTAAHCTSFRGHAPNIVRLGDLTLDEPTVGTAPDIGISTVYRHPDYKFSSHYHDIALLKLKSDAIIRIFKPICLHTENEIPIKLEAAGWGATENSSKSNHLLKVSLNATDYNDCAPKFSTVSKRKLQNGITNELQICAGGLGHDTCTGDSGGPLHYKVPGNVLEGHKHFVLAGVVSFGKGCGELGIYTRVSTYVSWIESIVWPSKVEKISEKKQDLTLINSTDEIIYQPPDDSRSGAFFQFEGDSCILKKADDNLSKNGTCTNIQNCDDAKKKLRINIRPQMCGFNGKDPIVCCPNEIKKK